MTNSSIQRLFPWNTNLRKILIQKGPERTKRISRITSIEVFCRQSWANQDKGSKSSAKFTLFNKNDDELELLHSSKVLSIQQIGFIIVAYRQDKRRDDSVENLKLIDDHVIRCSEKGGNMEKWVLVLFVVIGKWTWHWKTFLILFHSC